MTQYKIKEILDTLNNLQENLFSLPDYAEELSSI